MDWEAVRQFAEEDVITCLQSSPEFASAMNFWEQYFHAWNSLQDQHQPAVPYSIIARINRMETVNVQSTHVAEIVSAFMLASFH
jgi:hypothetical protein